MSKNHYGRRALAWLLSLVCLFGFIPTQARAADGAPESITLLKADYNTGSSSGLEQYAAPGGLGTVTIHNFRMTVDGEEVTGFCGDHSMTMGNRFSGQTWNNPGPVSENVYPLLAFYYWSCENDSSFNGGASGWANQVTNTYIQCCIWLQKAGKLPDYRSDPTGWVAAVAAQRKATYDHYGIAEDVNWTHEQDAQARIDGYTSGLYGTDWTFREYNFAGATTSGVPQPVIIGLRPTTDNQYAIKKVDTSGANVASVTFKVESADGSFSASVTTDASGLARFNSTAGDGWYTIAETNAPSNYQMNTSPVRVYLASDTPGEIQLANTKNPTTTTAGGSLQIRKVDIDNPTRGLAGAVIKLTHPASGRTSTFQSGADGWCVIPQDFVDNMQSGLWEAQEITPPTGYRLNPDVNVTKQTFLWDATTPVSLMFTNDSNVKIRFRKVDENGVGLAGAVIAAYKDGKPFLSDTTDAQGYLTVNGVDEGFYVFKELTPPAGYARLISPYAGVHIDPEQLNGEQTIDVTMTNYKKPILRIKKVDAITGAPVQGAVFEVAGINSDYKTTVTTGADGFGLLEDLESAAYEVTEQSVPYPYTLNADNHQTIALMGGEDRTLTFANYQRPSLKIIKIDTSGAPIAGAKFNVKVKDGSDIGTYTTDGSGEIFIENLDAQWYTVTETFVPESYILDPTPHDVLLEAGASGDGKAVYTLRLENLKKPKLTIYKVDSVVGGSVEGAKFQITYAGETYTPGSGSTSGSGVDLGYKYSDHNGEIKLENFAPGWYRVKEVEPPDGYQLKEPSTQEIYLAGDDDKSLTFENTPLNAIIVVKKDSVNGAPVEGATFRLKYLAGTSGTGGTVVATGTTSTSGTITWTRLQAGTYIVEELSAPDGYVIQDSAQTVYLSGLAQDTVTVTFDNAPKGSLLIKKVCSINPDVLLEGAQFEVKFTDGTYIGTTNGVYTTDAHGEILITDLEPGKSVIVTETRAPNGFVKDTAPQSIEIKAGQVVSLTFANAPKGTVIIEKRDSVTGKPLAGAEFRMTTAGCEVGQNGVIGDATVTSNGLFRTDADGKITISNLIPGSYVITEVKAPDGYLIDEPSRTITVTAGDTQTIVFKDTPKGTLSILKLDSKTRLPLKGADFKITDSAGAALDNYGGTISTNGYYTTDENGRIEIIDVRPGSYVVTEIKAPTGYQIDNPTQTVRVNPNDHQTLTFYDTALTTLVIHKYIDGTQNEPLKGVEFKVVYGDGSTVGPDDGVYYTDAKGEIVLTGLTPGMTVKAWETKTLDGYVLDGTPQDIQIKAGEVQTLTFWNQRQGALVIKKLDSITKQPLAGAEFSVKYADGRYVDNADGHLSSNGKYTTDANGEIRIAGLTGTVVVEETKAPDGYTIDEGTKRQTVTVNPAETQTLTFLNDPYQTVVIQKYIESTTKPLAGVTFLLTDGNGNKIGNGEYQTDANGRITLSVPVGSTIVARETKTVKGYVLNTMSQTITVKGGSAAQTVTTTSAVTSSAAVISSGDGSAENQLTFYDTTIGKLELIKVDEANRAKRLANAVFEIRRMNQGVVMTVTTDKNGRVLVDLDADDYYAVETKAPNGYKLDDTPHYFTIRDGKTTTVTVENMAVSGIEIHKTDAKTGDDIYGAKFLVYDAKGNTVGEITTDNRGYARIEVEAGRYRLRELECEGYLVDTESKTAVVKSGGYALVEWENTPITGQIQIYKYAAEYNAVTGTTPGAPLAGAVYEIVDVRSGKVVEQIVTDARGVAASRPLPIKRYQVKEVTAPAYWQVDGTVHDVTLEFAGQIIKLSSFDKPSQLGVVLTKTGIKEVLAGNKMAYTFTVANTSNVNLNSFYFHDKIPYDVANAAALTTGTYNARLTYRVLYKTNLNEYRVLASNLLSTNNYAFQMTGLPLMAGEVVTDIYYDFGTVPAGFQSVAKPTLTVSVNPQAVNGYQVINRADAGGQYGGTWETANAAWIAIVRNLTPVKRMPLPKTGY